jgi:hypothetical protein
LKILSSEEGWRTPAGRREGLGGNPVRRRGAIRPFASPETRQIRGGRAFSTRDDGRLLSDYHASPSESVRASTAFRLSK